MENLKINFVDEQFLKRDGIFDKDTALTLGGRIAGVCYDKEGYDNLLKEPLNKTQKRIEITLNNGHHSVYDHVNIRFNIQNIPKILAMVINNEKQYSTSEKSGRYTPVVRSENSTISETEEYLYDKWKNLLAIEIKERYPEFNEGKINKLAQENARYMVSVFVPAQMIYTTSLRQINNIAALFEKYIGDHKNDYFENRLSFAMSEMLVELLKLNVLEPALMANEKARSLSLFKKQKEEDEIYRNIYSTNYDASFTQLAQAHRHRTLDYSMYRKETKTYYIPPIIRENEVLSNAWLNDLQLVEDLVPQAEMVRVNETGKYEDFILKAKERLCTHAQLEIAMQTKETLEKYKEALIEADHYLKNDIFKYDKGARCTFPDYKCPSDCGFVEGKRLVRKI